MRTSFSSALCVAAVVAASLVAPAASARSGDVSPDGVVPPTSPSVARCDGQVLDTPKWSTPASGYALDTGIFSSNVKYIWTNTTATRQGAAPWVTGYDVGSATAPARRVVADWAYNDDVGSARPVTYEALSHNGGDTWGPPTAHDSTNGSPPRPQFGTRLRSGQVFAVTFIPSGNSNTADVPFNSTLTDSTGANQTQRFAHFMNMNMQWFRVNSPVVELPDGALLSSIYGVDATGKYQVAKVVRSTDGGLHFHPLHTFGAGDSTVQYTETNLAHRPDGSLIAVVRRRALSQNTGEVGVLGWSTSTDGGVTWSPLRDLYANISGGGPDLPSGKRPMPGINPVLQLLPTGIMALSSGKPDNWIAYSPTGNADDWSVATPTATVRCDRNTTGTTGGSAPVATPE